LNHVEGGRSRRPLVIGVLVAAIAAGIALAILLTGDDDGDKSSASAPTQTTATTETTDTEPTETVTTETSAPPKRDTSGVEQAVTTFVELAEQSDPAACDQVAGGAGLQLEECAAKAGIDLRTLPSSDELDVSSVRVAGARATAKLSNGASFALAKTGGKWKITGYTPFR
jgi:hypothetical protein